MQHKAKRNVQLTIINAFGALGYFFSTLQWFWAVMLYFSVIQSATLVVSPSADQPVEHSSGLGLALPGPVEAIILGVVVAVMLAVTIYILVKLPMSIVKASRKAVHKTTDMVVPVIIKTQHQPDTKKARVKITWKLIITLKLVLVIVPVLLTAASGLLEKQSIDYSIAMVLGCGLACFSLLFFVIQYTLAGLLRTKIARLL